MNYNELSNLVKQDTIPESIQVDVLTRAKSLINEGYEVEAIASTSSVTLDVYDEDGVRVDRIKRTFSRDFLENVSVIKGVSVDNLENFE